MFVKGGSLLYPIYMLMLLMAFPGHFLRIILQLIYIINYLKFKDYGITFCRIVKIKMVEPIRKSTREEENNGLKRHTITYFQLRAEHVY